MHDFYNQMKTKASVEQAHKLEDSLIAISNLIGTFP